MTSLPLHPLIVHLPVVLLPLVALMTIPALRSRRWFQWGAPLMLVLSFVAAAGSWAATWSGEVLATAQGQASALLERHAQLGEMTRNLALLTFLLLLVHTALHWHRSPAGLRAHGDRTPVLYTVLGALVLAAAGAGVVLAILTGHAGAQLVWLAG